MERGQNMTVETSRRVLNILELCGQLFDKWLTAQVAFLPT